ncbi:hypothetical protein SKAU_G00398310 [Synaphobranchus kaupii]|uniref:DUF4371 domain-containing protein n=1 Tax=Synaphobranchus kaupii TaxID=118154 RepID=A0A9Q1E8P0_SYNKA|nr:hypothetical protein SKAU_G00398310 [Synaphobranchus kaupii]
MLCRVCKSHQQKQRNGEQCWSKDPVYTLRRDVIHMKSEQHKKALRKEMQRLASERDGGVEQGFQLQVSLQHDAIKKAMETLYWLAKEEVAHTTKFSSFLDFAKDHLGCEVLAHLHQGGNASYRIKRILQEMLQIQLDHEAELTASQFVGLMCDETTDISTTKELVLLTRLVDSNGQAKSTFAKVIPLQDGTADTIAAALKTWLQEKNISIKKVMGFGSDGAAVMTGRKNGVAVLLQKENPLMTAIHCICHRLALPVGQAGERVPYIKNHFKPNLGELFRFFAYSACRMARLHQIQELLDLAQNTLKEAEDTRWLSHDEACKSLYRNLPAVLMTLDNENKNSATSTGLLIWLHKYSTQATLYLLCDLLPHLSSLSSHDPEWQGKVREPFVDQLLHNLEERFQSTELLSSFSILDPKQMPEPMPDHYGMEEVQCLTDHFGAGEGVVAPDAACDEWLGLQEYLNQNHYLSQEQLVTLLLSDGTMRELYPSLRTLAAVHDHSHT